MLSVTGTHSLFDPSVPTSYFSSETTSRRLTACRCRRLEDTRK
jgi:hypothetical protein